MFKIAPVDSDPDVLERSVSAADDRLTAIARNLGQYRPTVALAKDGRLFMACAVNSGAQTSAIYPRVYARPQLDTHEAAQTRWGRIKAGLARLRSTFAPFAAIHGVPGLSNTTLEGRATPIGFMSVSGCDVNWNGRSWSWTAGKLPVSLHIEGASDIHLPAGEAPANTQVIYLEIACQFRSEGRVMITGAQVRHSEALTLQGGTTMRYRPQSDEWTPGMIVSPIAYCISPKSRDEAPVCLRVGVGDLPYQHQFARPLSIGALMPSQ